MSSGDDIEAGRITTAESTTHIVGAIPSEQDVSFNGTVILQVGPQDGDLHPTGTLDAILGIGSNPPMPPGIPGGVGVIGVGGNNGGTGVRAFGNGGGTGVEAFGGRGGITTSVSGVDPAGAAIIALGGNIDTRFLTETNRSPNGPGVVAAAGDAPLPLPADSGNVGVFGQGGDMVSDTRTVDQSQTAVFGPNVAGPGVVGRGGTTKSNNGVPNAPVVNTGGGSAGVVGVAGGAPMPPLATISNVGVFAIGSVGAGAHGQSTSGSGIVGRSVDGAGVNGHAGRNRGGVFGSDVAPQLRLVPLPRTITSPAQIQGKVFPGDFAVTLMVDERATEIASLYFCTSVTTSGGANWTKLA